MIPFLRASWQCNIWVRVSFWGDTARVSWNITRKAGPLRVLSLPVTASTVHGATRNYTEEKDLVDSVQGSATV